MPAPIPTPPSRSPITAAAFPSRRSAPSPCSPRGKRGGHVGVVSGIDCERQSDHHFRQSRPPRRRGDLSALARDRLCHADRRRPATTQVAERGYRPPNRSAAEPAFESPIAELLAAIEAEQSRPEPQSQRRRRGSGGRSRAAPAVPHRAVQQVPPCSNCRNRRRSRAPRAIFRSIRRSPNCSGSRIARRPRRRRARRRNASSGCSSKRPAASPPTPALPRVRLR